MKNKTKQNKSKQLQNKRAVFTVLKPCTNPDWLETQPISGTPTDWLETQPISDVAKLTAACSFKDPVLPIMHRALTIIGGHFLDVDKSEN